MVADVSCDQFRMFSVWHSMQPKGCSNDEQFVDGSYACPRALWVAAAQQPSDLVECQEGSPPESDLEINVLCKRVILGRLV
ncbi:hypothetical protein SAMN05216554_0443 [Herbiconiux ginsengi]|uniref:Uncharacterized protein n=1 Tax=Herbiconiux ginsengi TaxID=381665 RepID=A0A1H3K6A9_9MICO|nr:hypothetical protein SAMN05216554_0443 [Herbiconiux ginsengi]